MCAVIPPLSLIGPVMSIRRYGKRVLTTEDLIKNQTFTTGMLDFMSGCVEARLNIVISGGTGAPMASEPEVLTPAVPVRKSVTPDYIVCLDDGRKFKSLKRHLASLGMTPDQYRAKWGLAADYPMVASNYAATRSALAKKIGLGQNRKRG